ncbi:cell division protein FtsN [Aggregatibacter kilianii]|uniref:cell division protein FtsN n=1 Tax=Aggregatibacter kilianii TaxID=2025884 RepID=UPI000D65E1EF|nr:cell division protein FtsN [Aggregatibacter kilianii]RDE87051.1 cell division protein FtsN [Aggregatibacter aphrophilus]
MAQRDYAARGGAKKKKKQKKNNKSLLFIIAAVVVAAFGLGLYLLKEKAPDPVVQPVETTEKTQPKSVLPNRPEEVWSYIKALETRTVPIDDNPKSLDKNMRLTEEQRKILSLMEEEQKQAELARSKAAEAQATAQQPAQQPTQQVTQQAVQPQAKPQVVEAKKTTPPKEEKKAEQTVKVEPQKKPEPVPQPQPQQQAPQPVSQQTTNNGERRYGLQCGAFKNKAQADTLQAKLSALGLNARVNASADWNRVIVGPAGDRNAAVKMQEKAKSVINCVVIGM